MKYMPSGSGSVLIKCARCKAVNRVSLDKGVSAGVAGVVLALVAKG